MDGHGGQEPEAPACPSSRDFHGLQHSEHKPPRPVGCFSEARTGKHSGFLKTLILSSAKC